MDFVLFHTPLIGDGMVIGVNGIIHIVISHGITIGVMSMIALAEYVALRKGVEAAGEFAGDLLRPTAIIITAT